MQRRTAALSLRRAADLRLRAHCQDLNKTSGFGSMARRSFRGLRLGAGGGRLLFFLPRIIRLCSLSK